MLEADALPLEPCLGLVLLISTHERAFTIGVVKASDKQSKVGVFIAFAFGEKSSFYLVKREIVVPCCLNVEPKALKLVFLRLVSE